MFTKEIQDRFIIRQIWNKVFVYYLICIPFVLVGIIFCSLVLSGMFKPPVESLNYTFGGIGVGFLGLSAGFSLYAVTIGQKERKILITLLQEGYTVRLQVREKHINRSYRQNGQPQYIFEIYDEKGEHFTLRTFQVALINVLQSAPMGYFEALHSHKYPSRIVPVSLVEALGKESYKKRGSRLQV